MKLRDTFLAASLLIQGACSDRVIGSGEDFGTEGTDGLSDECPGVPEMMDQSSQEMTEDELRETVLRNVTCLLDLAENTDLGPADESGHSFSEVLSGKDVLHTISNNVELAEGGSVACETMRFDDTTTASCRFSNMPGTGLNYMTINTVQAPHDPEERSVSAFLDSPDNYSQFSMAWDHTPTEEFEITLPPGMPYVDMDDGTLDHEYADYPGLEDEMDELRGRIQALAEKVIAVE